MTNSNDGGAPRPQAVVAGDLGGAGTLNGRAGASVFPIGGPDGRGGTAAWPNPYELPSASLAACTAMTIRLQARRRKIPLSRVQVAVSYHHGGDGGRGSFERSVRLPRDRNLAQAFGRSGTYPRTNATTFSAGISQGRKESSPHQQRQTTPGASESAAAD